MKSKRAKVYLLVSICSYFIMAASVFLLPFSRKADSSDLSAVGYILGIVFWFGILSGIVFLVLSWMKIRKQNNYQNWKEKTHPGVISFFKSRGGSIADICFLLTVVLLIISDYVMHLPYGIVLVFLFLTLYSFCLHFVLNGRVYRYLFSKERKKESDYEKEN